MYLIKAISLIDNKYNDTLYIDRIENFKKMCINKNYNYYLYNKSILIDKIENDII